MRFATNPFAERSTYTSDEARIVSCQSAKHAHDVTSRWPGYAVTPLHVLHEVARPLSSESQQGKEVGEIHEPFGFVPLGVSQGLSTILFIQQRMQALLHAVRQPKLG